MGTKKQKGVEYQKMKRRAFLFQSVSAIGLMPMASTSHSGEKTNSESAFASIVIEKVKLALQFRIRFDCVYFSL